MSFSVHTFEVNPSGVPSGFAFHESVGEGQELYFLSKFHANKEDAQAVAEEIFGSILESLKTSKAPDSYDKLEDALKAGNLEARKHAKALAKTPDIVVAFFDFHHLYLSQSGASEAYLIRGTNVSQISETPDQGDDLFLNILSGQVAVDDSIVLSSTRVLRALTAGELSDFFARSDFGDSVNLFRQKLSSASEEDIVVTVIGIGKSGETEHAGFLSKVVGKVKGKTEAIEEDKESEEEEKEDKKEEVVEEAKAEVVEEPKVVKPSKVASLLASVKTLPKKNVMAVAGVVGLVLLLGIGAKAIMGYESEETQRLREQLSIARTALEQADVFLIQGERQSAGEQLGTAQEAVTEVLNSKSKTFRSDAQFLLADIQEKKLQVENAKKVQPVALADLGVKNDNLDAAGLLRLKEKLFAYDLSSLYKTVRNVVEKGIRISDKETILAAAAREDQNTLIFLTDSPRVFEYREGSINAMSTQDESWKRGIDVKTYGQYIYVLDPVENQIWKYQRGRVGYTAAVAYNQGADLSRGISLAIDGSIYVLSDEGNLQKLFRGVLVDYEFRDLPSVPFSGQNLKLYTSPELDFLYVLDPDNSRILVFVKGERFATYKKQVLFDVADVRDFVVDDAGQKVNILTPDKIYEFSL